MAKPDSVKAMLAVPRLQVGENTPAPDGKRRRSPTFDIDTIGLEPAWTQLAGVVSGGDRRPGSRSLLARRRIAQRQRAAPSP